MKGEEDRIEVAWLGSGKVQWGRDVFSRNVSMQSVGETTDMHIM
jgi:hypothetical protein